MPVTEGGERVGSLTRSENQDPPALTPDAILKATLLDEVSDIVLVHDIDGFLVYVNKAACQALEYSADEMYGMSVAQVDHNAVRTRHIMAALRRHGRCVFTTSYAGRSGKEITVEVSASVIKYSDERIILNVARDVSKRVQSQERLKLRHRRLIAMNNQLRLRNERDPFTDLYNRLYFERALGRIEGNREYYPVSIFLLDIDGLKLVNDILGHSKGDIFIQKAVSIIKGNFRNEDIIARLGGDEFAVLMPGSNREVAGEKAGVLRRMALESLDEPLPVCYSVGFATTENIFKSLYDVLREADANMYREKETNREHIFAVVSKSLWRLRNEGYHDF
ncbi:MAG: sensor domain-containing diguanylate cyclase [Peptococcaceae bacterium]|jgi:diguanylate cyclase (GGDEF)-like protein/PAS domain S-box-containing protein|nr:sensor domain-containing diguanylate cyclase [Peptococcaceae bacterium]